MKFRLTDWSDLSVSGEKCRLVIAYPSLINAPYISIILLLVLCELATAGILYNHSVIINLSCWYHTIIVNSKKLRIQKFRQNVSATFPSYPHPLHQKVTFSYGTSLAVTMLSLWLSARYTIAIRSSSSMIHCCST